MSLGGLFKFWNLEVMRSTCEFTKGGMLEANGDGLFVPQNIW